MKGARKLYIQWLNEKCNLDQCSVSMDGLVIMASQIGYFHEVQKMVNYIEHFIDPLTTW